MKLESQVCTLRQSKKINSFGIGQSSLYVWGENANQITESFSIEGTEDCFFSAYTASELGILLPDMLISENKQYELVFIKEYDNEWLCRYCRMNNLCDVHPKIDPMAANTLAEVLAEMLIQLLDRNEINVNECSKRLLES